MNTTDIKEKIRKSFVIEILIVLSQIALLIFWTLQQGNLYWDVYYTLERTHYTSASTEGPHYINDDDEFERNKWIDVSYIKDTMVVSRDNSVLSDPPLYVLKTALHQPYWILMNIFGALLSPGEFSTFPAICLNIIFFIVTQIVVWNTIMELMGDREVARLSILLYGFCGTALSMNTYVRFYSFSIMLMALFVYLHVRLLKEERWYISIVYEGLVAIVAYWMIGVTQLTLFYVVIFVMAFSIVLMYSKRFLSFALYVLPMGMGGVAYLALRTNYIYMLMHMSEVVSETSSEPIRWIIESITTLTPYKFLFSLTRTIACIGRYAYGFWAGMIVFGVLIVVMLVYDRSILKNITPMEMTICISMIGFMIVAIVLNLYILPRYISYVYPQILGITALILVQIIRNEKVGNKWYFKCAVVFVILSIMISTITGRRIDFIFAEDREPLTRVRKSGITDIVVTQEDDFNLAEMMYEVTVNVDDNSRMMAVVSPEASRDVLPDDFIMVNRSEYDTIEGFKRLGYQVDWVEETYCFYYYHLIR